jgi:hypothetical protein
VRTCGEGGEEVIGLWKRDVGGKEGCGRGARAVEGMSVGRRAGEGGRGLWKGCRWEGGLGKGGEGCGRDVCGKEGCGRGARAVEDAHLALPRRVRAGDERGAAHWVSQRGAVLAHHERMQSLRVVEGEHLERPCAVCAR